MIWNEAVSQYNYLWGALDDLLVKGDKRIILLQTNHDISNIFKNYLRENKEPPEDKAIKIR